MRHGRRVARTALGVLALTAAIAGCGSSSKNSSTSNSKNTSSSKPASTGSTASGSKSPINIGSIVAVSGALTFPDIAGAVKGAVMGINARGGIDGHPVVLDACDEGNSPNTAVACAHKLVSDHVVAEIGGQSITAETQIGSVLEAAGIPQIGDDSSGGTWVNQSNEFLTYKTSTTIEAVGALKECALQGYTKIGNPNLAVPTTIAIAKVVNAAAAKLGVKIVSSPSVSLTETDFTPVAQAMASAGVQCVDPEIPPAGIIGLLKAEQTLGHHVQLNLNSGILRPNDIKTLGALGNGMVIVSSYPVPTDTAQYPVLRRFQADMKLAASSGAPYNQTDAASGALNSWFGVQAFASVEGSVLKGGGQPTAGALLAALKKTKNVNLGLPTLWSPNNPGPSWGPRVWTGVVYPLTVKNEIEHLSGSPLNVLTLAGG